MLFRRLQWKSSHRRRGQGRVFASGLCFAANQRRSVDAGMGSSIAMTCFEVTIIIIPLHVITESDHTSAFYGHMKKPVFSKVINDPDASELLK